MDPLGNLEACPLCGGEAMSHRYEGYNAKLFQCRRCNQFVTTRAAEPVVRRAPANWRENVTVLARCTPAGQVLRIQNTRPIDDPVDKPALPLYARYRYLEQLKVGITEQGLPDHL